MQALTLQHAESSFHSENRLIAFGGLGLPDRTVASSSLCFGASRAALELIYVDPSVMRAPHLEEILLYSNHHQPEISQGDKRICT